MKAWTAAVLCLGLLFAAPSSAQERKAPPAAKKQDQRLRDCAARAGKRTGRQRQAFMTACLKGGKPKARPPKR